MKRVILFLTLALSTQLTLAQDLREAMSSNDLQTIQTFVEAGRDIDGRYIAERYTLLCAAVKSGNEEMVVYLLRKGASTEVSSNGKTPLMYAAKYDELEIAKSLVEYGANRNAVNEKGSTPLGYARRYENMQMVEFLEKE